MYRSTVSPLSVWLLCATSFFIFCQSSLQQDTLYLVMELASASRLLILAGLPAAGLIVRTVSGTSASSFGGNKRPCDLPAGHKTHIIVASNNKTATKSMKLWKMGPNSPVCPQIIVICGQIKDHVHNVAQIMADTMKVVSIIALPMYS